MNEKSREEEACESVRKAVEESRRGLSNIGREVSKICEDFYVQCRKLSERILDDERRFCRFERAIKDFCEVTGGNRKEAIDKITAAVEESTRREIKSRYETLLNEFAEAIEEASPVFFFEVDSQGNTRYRRSQHQPDQSRVDAARTALDKFHERYPQLRRPQDANQQSAAGSGSGQTGNRTDPAA